MKLFEYNILADYFQFVLLDEASNVDRSILWNERTIVEKLAVAQDLILIGTGRNATVPVAVEVHEIEPRLDLSDSWDQIVEYEIDIPSGRVLLLGNVYLSDAPRIDVEPGTYRLRLFYGNLESVSPDGLRGDDKYRIQLWPVAKRSLVQPVFLRKTSRTA